MKHLEWILDYKIIESNKFLISVADVLSLFLIFFIAWLLGKLIKRYFRHKAKEDKIGSKNAFALSRLCLYFLWTFAILFGLESIGISMSILLAGSAALLVGIGLGLQQIFKDLLSGVFILFERKIRVGDMVQIVNNNILGTVKSTGIRTSEIETPDGLVLIIPNSMIISDAIINWTAGEEKKPIRANIHIGVDYKSDIQLVKKLLLESTQTHPLLSSKFAPFVRFSAFGDSSLLFDLYFWVDSPSVAEDTKSDIRYKIFEVFETHGIQIPFPQRVIHLPKNKENNELL